MSYVLAKDIGCSQSNNPYIFLEPGIDVLFNNTTSIATWNGKNSGDSPVAAKTEVMMGFFSQQVEAGGWTDIHTDAYRSLNAQSCSNVFLPCHYSGTCYTNNSSRADNYNLGQIYLQCAMGYTFLTFPHNSIAYASISPTEPTGHRVPVFTDKMAAAIGAKHIKHFITPSKSKLYGTMLLLALREANAATDLKGPAGSTLTFVCNILEHNKPGWSEKKPMTIMKQWWNLQLKMK